MTDANWYDRNQRRQEQKKRNPRAWREGHFLRKQHLAFPGKGEKWITCKGGAFGNLKTFDPEKYSEWAQGTEGTLGSP